MATQSSATGLAIGRESDPSAAWTESAIFDRLKTSALLLVLRLLVLRYPETMDLEHAWQYGLIAPNVLALLVPKGNLSHTLEGSLDMSLPAPFAGDLVASASILGVVALPLAVQEASAEPPPLPEPIPRYDLPRLSAARNPAAASA